MIVKNIPNKVLNPVWLIAILILASCSPTKTLQEDEKLLVRNNIEINGESHVGENEIDDFIKQEPNRKLLWTYRFHMRVYNMAQRINFRSDTTDMGKTELWLRKRKRKFHGWLESIGEAPVVMDTLLADKTADQIEYFMKTKGHFNTNVERRISFRNHNADKAVVTYYIYPGNAYVVSDVDYIIPDSMVSEYVNTTRDESLIRIGDFYDEKILKQERERITTDLKNSGYYYFDKAYIQFLVDSMAGHDSLKITLKILNQSFISEENPDSIITKEHQQCKINRIYINTQYEGAFSEKTYQINEYQLPGEDIDSATTYYFLYNEPIRFKKEVLIQKILLSTGQLYKKSDIDLTYNFLSELRNFRYIGIDINPTADTIIGTDEDYIWLDCHINLSRQKRQFFEVKMDATTSAGDPGLSSSIIYHNRNLSKGAEILNISVNGALEVQRIIDEDEQPAVFNNLPFNTLELGAEGNLLIPKFLAPIRQERFNKSFKPRTSIIAGANYQERPDYRRYISKLSYGYDWHYRNNYTLLFNLIELNAVSIFPEASFIEKIEQLNDQRLKSSYSDHIITASNFTMVFSNQDYKKNSSFSYLRLNLESAGLLVNLFNKSYTVNEEGVAMIFNIPYAQYLRINADYRHYFQLTPNHQLAFRAAVGLGNPYGNMSVLPFEKSFFVGGANGLRAWPIRTVGPGSFTDSLLVTQFDKTGDLGIETSLEYRFPIYKTFKGALFLDAGNVWLKNKSDKFPGGEFELNRMVPELAVGTGIGFRFDFSFFVIRLDAAVKVRDPSNSPGQRWVVDEASLKKVNWNFAIDYPF